MNIEDILLGLSVNVQYVVLCVSMLRHFLLLQDFVVFTLYIQILNSVLCKLRKYHK